MSTLTKNIKDLLDGNPSENENFAPTLVVASNWNCIISFADDSFYEHQTQTFKYKISLTYLINKIGEKHGNNN